MTAAILEAARLAAGFGLGYLTVRIFTTATTSTKETR